MLRIIFVVVFIGYQASAQAPPFCKGAECPKYSTVAKTQGYEIREYGPLVWITSYYIGRWYNNVIGDMFKPIFNYMQGNNSLGLQLDMTVPLLNKVEGKGKLGTKYRMHVLIPSLNINNIPRPLDRSLLLVKIPQTTYYVRSFDGYAYGQRYMSELQGLVKDINNSTIYDGKMFYTAAYDSPKQTTKRHNEIWLKKI